jgi:hypothetical protein
MKSLFSIILLGAVGLAAQAQAAPTRDPDAWAKQFTAAAIAGDQQRITEAASSIADPDMDLKRLKSVMNAVEAGYAHEKPRFGSTFGDVRIGDFLHRFRIAVIFGASHYLFYNVDLVRTESGWQLSHLLISSNLNEILSDPWPFK